MSQVLHNRRRKQTAIVLGLAAVISILPAVLLSTPPPSPHTQVSYQPVHQASQHKVLGAMIVNTQYSLQVIATDLGEVDNTTQTRRFTAHISLHNESSEVMQVSPGLQMSVVDTKGTVYSMTAEYLPAGTVVGGPISPGATEILDIDFKLPATASVAAFRYQPDAAAKATRITL